MCLCDCVSCWSFLVLVVASMQCTCVLLVGAHLTFFLPFLLSIALDGFLAFCSSYLLLLLLIVLWSFYYTKRLSEGFFLCFGLVFYVATDHVMVVWVQEAKLPWMTAPFFLSVLRLESGLINVVAERWGATLRGHFSSTVQHFFFSLLFCIFHCIIILVSFYTFFFRCTALFFFFSCGTSLTI